MQDIDRRQLTAGMAALSLGLLRPLRQARAAARARVVVIGGGPGGATVAIAVKRAAPDIDVTLIEPKKQYTSCFYSNHFIGGFMPISRITNTYAGLVALGIGAHAPEDVDAVSDRDDRQEQERVEDEARQPQHGYAVREPARHLRAPAVAGGDLLRREAGVAQDLAGLAVEDVRGHHQLAAHRA